MHFTGLLSFLAVASLAAATPAPAAENTSQAFVAYAGDATAHGGVLVGGSPTVLVGG